MSLLVGVAQNVGRQHDDQAYELDEQHAEEEDEEERTPMAHATTKVGRERLPIFAGSLHHVFHQDVHQGLDQDDDDDPISETNQVLSELLQAEEDPEAQLFNEDTEESLNPDQEANNGNLEEPDIEEQLLSHEKKETAQEAENIASSLEEDPETSASDEISEMVEQDNQEEESGFVVPPFPFGFPIF